MLTSLIIFDSGTPSSSLSTDMNHCRTRSSGVNATRLRRRGSYTKVSGILLYGLLGCDYRVETKIFIRVVYQGVGMSLRAVVAETFPYLHTFTVVDDVAAA